ncbi:hypothetical protein FHX81_2468 [Saccharothrix saharensis]|uniref:Uncharacterized protein n=1 Tax=Saccharothrix saharensis TaxID=571190 RepID=A0A543JBD1_9PSEU|nr:hypothetical protein [Saccharothrix saharensis]TQM80145.1 hypothetical protein FHX81_2468 [Saccharothrix saharensis]
MTLALLAPCYGNRETRERFHNTIEGSVDFTESRYRDLLPPADFDRLLSLHPSGKAHFWGAISRHDKPMERLRDGGVVIFVGEKKVKATGEIGHLFRNKGLADLMWRQHANSDSFVNVYSVLNVQITDYPITDLWSIDGFTHGDYVYGQRVVDHEKAARLIRAFRLNPSTAEAELDAKLIATAELIGTSSRVIPVERTHVDIVWHEIAARKYAQERVEAQLVAEFCESQPHVAMTSFVTASGKRADLYYRIDSDVVVAEAKSLNTHGKVRESVAQLLDYAASSPEPVTRLMALFPERPDTEGIQFMHRLGIDCVYRSASKVFTTEEAPHDRRQYMHPIWQGR